ncbi:MAG: hypothetical protein RR620_08700 [Clostridium sp.]
MYREIGSSEIHFLQNRLKDLINAKKFTLDKKYTAFNNNELSLIDSIDLYLKVVVEHKSGISQSFDEVLINMLCKNNYLTTKHVKTLLEQCLNISNEDDWDYDSGFANSENIIEIIMGLWNKVTEKRGMIWDLHCLAEGNDNADEINKYFKNLQQSIRDYVCYDEFMETVKDGDNTEQDFYQWYYDHACEDAKVFCFPEINLNPKILSLLSNYLPVHSGQISTEVWCENDNLYFVFADSSLLDGLRLRFVIVLLASFIKEAMYV